MRSPEVAVILVNYNSPNDTYRCLESLSCSTLMPLVVVVDNASYGDGVISEEKTKSIYGNVHIIYNQCNEGFGGGNNAGLSWALANVQADYLFVLNNDTTVLPCTIEDLVHYLQENSETGMCSPAIFRLNEPDVYWFGGGYIEWARGGAISPNIHKKLGSEVTVEKNTFISGCAMFMRRDVLVRVGGFSADYFMYCEDIDYCQRVLDAGYEVGYVKDAKILHDAHASVVKDRTKFVTPQHWSNENLTFALENMVYGSLLNLKKHSRGFERLMGLMRIILRYLKWCVSYIAHARMDGVRAVIKGIRFYTIGKRPV